MDSGIRQNLDLILVAIKRADGDMLFNPTPDTTLQGGDTLIVVGMRHNLEKFEDDAGSLSSRQIFTGPF